MAISEKIGELAKRMFDLVGPSIRAVVVGRKDGLPIAHYGNVNAKIFAAFISLISGTLNRVGSEIGGGELSYAVVHYQNGVIVLKSKDIVNVAVVANSDANLGLILLEMDRLVDGIVNILRSER